MTNLFSFASAKSILVVVNKKFHFFFQFVATEKCFTFQSMQHRNIPRDVFLFTFLRKKYCRAKKKRFSRSEIADLKKLPIKIFRWLWIVFEFSSFSHSRCYKKQMLTPHSGLVVSRLSSCSVWLQLSRWKFQLLYLQCLCGIITR